MQEIDGGIPGLLRADGKLSRLREQDCYRRVDRIGLLFVQRKMYRKLATGLVVPDLRIKLRRWIKDTKQKIH